MVIFQIILLSDKRVISKERNTIRASNPRASLTWTDNTSKIGYGYVAAQDRTRDLPFPGADTLPTQLSGPVIKMWDINRK